MFINVFNYYFFLAIACLFQMWYIVFYNAAAYSNKN